MIRRGVSALATASKHEDTRAEHSVSRTSYSFDEPHPPPSPAPRSPAEVPMRKLTAVRKSVDPDGDRQQPTDCDPLRAGGSAMATPLPLSLTRLDWRHHVAAGI